MHIRCYTKRVKHYAIIFDLDGTAIDSPRQKLPSAGLIRAVGKLQPEYYLCAATGRVWTFAKPVLTSLHLTDPCIISAGTQICDPRSGKILWQKVIPDRALADVISVLKEFPEYKVLHNDGTEEDYFHGGVSPSAFVHTEPVYFLEQVFVPDHIAVKIYEKLQRIPDVTCVMVIAQKPGTRDLHVINHAATKEHAVAELIQRIGVDRTNTIGIGDSHNDIHLFRGVEKKIAMGNSIKELKDMADEIIGTAADDGLATYFKRLSFYNE